MKENVSIIWFENDLRVHDHEGLWKASQNNHPVIGIYVFNPNKLKSGNYGFPKISHHRMQFIHESLIDLKQKCHKLNIPFYVFTDTSLNAVKRMLEYINIKTLYYQKAYGRDEVQNHEIVINAFKDIRFYAYDTKPLVHKDDLPTTIDDLPEQFTQFRQLIEKNSVIKKIYPTIQPLEKHIQVPIKDDLDSFKTYYKESPTAILHGGETEALNRIQHYFFKTKKIKFYKQTRNQMLRFDDSSKLSPYLAIGCVSPRYVYEQIKSFEALHGKNISTYWLYFELLWRDYFHFVHVKFGDHIFSQRGLFNREYHVIDNTDFIEAWKNGITGYPLVDANMRELEQTGWMSNRGRQNVASFFIKYIKQDWRVGAAWFEYLLLDFDVSSHVIPNDSYLNLIKSEFH
jgi:deoxyribodipyrimidine photo-lyase